MFRSWSRSLVPVNTRDIAVFMKDSLIHLFTFAGDKHYPDFQSVEDIGEMFNPHQFFRANRQCIVNMDAVMSVKPKENSKLILTLKPPLKFEVDMSREKAALFKRWMDS